MVVNKPLIRPHFLGLVALGGVGPLDFHEIVPLKHTPLKTNMVHLKMEAPWKRRFRFWELSISGSMCHNLKSFICFFCLAEWAHDKSINIMAYIGTTPLYWVVTTRMTLQFLGDQESRSKTLICHDCILGGGVDPRHINSYYIRLLNVTNRWLDPSRKIEAAAWSNGFPGRTAESQRPAGWDTKIRRRTSKP